MAESIGRCGGPRTRTVGITAAAASRALSPLMASAPNRRAPYLLAYTPTDQREHIRGSGEVPRG
jgi:hypothetical protein